MLRPGQDASSVVWPGDESGVHYAVRGPDGAPVAVGSLVREGAGRRVRGMATAPEWRGRGLGAEVLRALLSHAGGELVWCQARPPAVPLYERAGFVVAGEPFDVPGVGPHVRMELRGPAPL